MNNKAKSIFTSKYSDTVSFLLYLKDKTKIRRLNKKSRIRKTPKSENMRCKEPRARFAEITLKIFLKASDITGKILLKVE